MASSLASSCFAARLPIVVVLGATGTGKSKLALEIASRFKGEIISADSMQVYKGLDIVTNKVTTEEQAQVQHHLLDFVDPLSRYTVVDFRNAALPVVEKLLAQSKMPVIVGGTNYYIESLLWNVLVDSLPASEEKSSAPEKLVYDRDKEFYVQSAKRNASGGSKDGDESAWKKSKLNSGAVLGSECSVDGGGGDDGDDGCCGPKSVESVDNNNSIGSAKESGDVLCEGDAKENEPSGGKGNCLGNEKSEDDSDDEREKGKVEGEGDSAKCAVWQDTDIPTEELYQMLQEVDPDAAAQYHPNNRRKIIRSLQVWEQTGRRHSEVLREQQEQEGGSRLGGALRYPSTVILWVTCDQDVLDQRLDRRVDDMIERGLLQELKDFHADYNKQRLKEGQLADYTKGIFQSIGFKEFHQYLVLTEEEQQTKDGRKLYEAGVAALKQVWSALKCRWYRMCKQNEQRKVNQTICNGCNMTLCQCG
ncbi:tRNA dimethylallyltransferase-like [Penaeus japonicus]|uniref:tRNA dimethylallyltransferase-like n=1 Tax=Penaeus japonicus TaxID=27405 RepID=UPI001C710CC6|nr:tRNA dimethylallyltransferase-like [Penaeus japonicus]